MALIFQHKSSKGFKNIVNGNAKLQPTHQEPERQMAQWIKQRGSCSGGLGSIPTIGKIGEHHHRNYSLLVPIWKFFQKTNWNQTQRNSGS